MTDIPNENTVTENNQALVELLRNILTPQGLKQNLEIGLNMSDKGEIPIQILLINQNISSLVSDLTILANVKSLTTALFFCILIPCVDPSDHRRT